MTKVNGEADFCALVFECISKAKLAVMGNLKKIDFNVTDGKWFVEAFDTVKVVKSLLVQHL